MATKRIKTKDRIIKGSIELFNRDGVSEISTNHIAEYLNMSPGNLYYYFSNKEQIIRGIFDQMRGQIETLWQDKNQNNPLMIVSEYIQVVFTLLIEYKFFFSDLPQLLRKDAQLKADYVNLQQRFERELAAVYWHLKQVGVFKFSEESECQYLATNTWIVAVFWHCYREPSNDLDQQPAVKDILHQIMFLLTPYIEQAFLAMVRGLFDAFASNYQQPQPNLGTPSSQPSGKGELEL